MLLLLGPFARAAREGVVTLSCLHFQFHRMLQLLGPFARAAHEGVVTLSCLHFHFHRMLQLLGPVARAARELFDKTYRSLFLMPFLYPGIYGRGHIGIDNKTNSNSI